MIDQTEIFATQQSIIDLQTDIINKLFLQLMQYVNIEEIDNLTFIDDISQDVKIRNTIMK